MDCGGYKNKRLVGPLKKVFLKSRRFIGHLEKNNFKKIQNLSSKLK